MKPEFFPYFWIIYVNYVLYKRYKENKHLKKYEIILAIVSSIIICGGHFFMIYFGLSKDIQFIIDVNDTLRMYKNDDIRMYNFNCITDTIVEVITTCNTYTLLTVHLL